MPRMDDPNIKTKEIKAYKRKSLRPWDDLNEFKPEPVLTSEKLIPIKEKENNKVTTTEQKDNQTGNKKETNRGQTETVSEQKGNIREPIREPIREQVTTIKRKQLGNQLGNDFFEDLPVLEDVSRLCGLQRKLLIYIVENCKSRGLLRTTPITNESLRQLLQTDGDSVKTTIHRLIKKNLVGRDKGKRGKGGFTIFIITESIRNAVIESERQLNIGNQLENQLVNAISKLSENNRETYKETTSPSSNSSYYNKNTITTGDQINKPLPEEWEKIDFSSLQSRGVKFSKQDVIQFFNYLENYEASEFQESIDGLAYDLDNNHIKTPAPRNLLCGIIRKGGIYVSEYYVSPEQKIINEMAERARKKKQENEEAIKLAQEDKFNLWLEKIEKEEIRKHLPTYLLVDLDTNGKAAKAWVFRNLFLNQNNREAIEKTIKK